MYVSGHAWHICAQTILSYFGRMQFYEKNINYISGEHLLFFIANANLLLNLRQHFVDIDLFLLFGQILAFLVNPERECL